MRYVLCGFIYITYLICSTACQHSSPPEHRRGGTLDGSEQWGYATPRGGVHMFWWLYHTTHPDGILERPLLIWIQGGPGLSGTGLGNFAEIGPLDVDLHPRNTTWLQECSLLFIDSPVGSGFSYHEDESLIPTDAEAIGDDLYGTFLEILVDNMDLVGLPVYIFGQSYGGKMAPAFARRLQKSLPDFPLKGVGIGNGYTSPPDTVMHFGNLLYEMSLLDEFNLYKIQQEATRLHDIMVTNQTESGLTLIRMIMKAIPGLNVYNINDMYPVQMNTDNDSDDSDSDASDSDDNDSDDNDSDDSDSDDNDSDDSTDNSNDCDQNSQRSHRTKASKSSPIIDGQPILLYSTIYDQEYAIRSLMNGAVRKKLKIIPKEVTWEMYSYDVYAAQRADFDNSATYMVEELLANGVDVFVYQGQLDLICNTPGALSWVRNLIWRHHDTYTDAPRTPLYDPASRKLEMFVKDHHFLHMYWILNSGHAVPAEVPEVGLRMLRRMLTTSL